MTHPLRIIATIAIVLAVIVPIYWQLTWTDAEEQARFDRGETELVIANLADAILTLYRAGPHLRDTVRISEFDGKRIWLKPGNYFVKAVSAGPIAHFPVPLTGYRCGPDDDKTFLVTIRPSIVAQPPRLLNHLPEFVYIPSGGFLLGDRQNPREPHYTWLTGFFIAPFEVTNGEFREFLGASDGYDDPAHWTEHGRRWKSTVKSKATALLQPTDADYQRFGLPDQPVVLVTWFEANAFCRWLSRKYANVKWQFALPTDAEWEKAARGPDNFDFALSMFISDAEVKSYNWKKNPDTAVPVFGIEASRLLYLPNRYGLYHMTGNVVEWAQSTDRPFNREHPYEDDERNHDEATGLRVARGGSWYSAAISYMYIPYRDSFQPEHCTKDIGFRVVARALP